MPPATVVLDPRDRPQTAEALRNWHDPAAGRVVCTLTPGTRTLHGVGVQALISMGKSADATGSSRHTSEAWRRLESWSVGEPVQHLLIERAHLAVPSAWSGLADLGRKSGARITLLVQGTAMSRGQEQVARDHGMATTDVRALRSILRAGQASAEAETDEARFPSVPSDDFPTFLASCQELLVGAELGQATDAFHAGARHARESLRGVQEQPEPDELRSIVEGVVRNARSVDEALCRVRGAQVELLRRNVLLKVTRDALAGGWLQTQVAPCDARAAVALRQFDQPRYAAIGLMALVTGWPPTELARLKITDVEPSGHSVMAKGGRFPVPARASGILRSHLHYRALEGSLVEDPLFVCERRDRAARGNGALTAHGIQVHLTMVSKHTGLFLLAPPSRNGGSWLRRHGISLHSL